MFVLYAPNKYNKCNHTSLCTTESLLQADRRFFYNWVTSYVDVSSVLDFNQTPYLSWKEYYIAFHSGKIETYLIGMKNNNAIESGEHYYLLRGKVYK